MSIAIRSTKMKSSASGEGINKEKSASSTNYC